MSGQSDSPAVEYVEARHSVSVPMDEQRTVWSGFFIAKKPGKAEITFKIADSRDDDVEGGVIRCAVMVGDPKDQ